MKRAVSLVLIVVAALLIYWGYDLQQQLETQLILQVAGETPEQVWHYYLTGVAALLVGGFSLWKTF